MQHKNIEELLKEAVEKVTDYGYNDEYGYYIDWADGVSPILKSFLLHAYNLGIEKAVDELGSNPNEDGSISPNIQHWIEQKQAQLTNLLTKDK